MGPLFQPVTSGKWGYITDEEASLTLPATASLSTFKVNEDLHRAAMKDQINYQYQHQLEVLILLS
jgi:hypothetical protein